MRLRGSREIGASPLVLVLLGVALVGPGWAQQQGSDEPDEPVLPPGLEEPEEPALPPGLGEDDTNDEDETQPEKNTLADRFPRGLRSFVEARVGPRIHGDPAHSKDYTLAEIRLQTAYDRSWKSVSLAAKADLIPNAVLEEVDSDLRKLRLTFRPAKAVDLQLGRQIMTWGTGDLLFINDLFPKDWQSFFIGRDEEYLKAPSDALRLGWFPGRVSVDLVYTPEFDPDRFIRGERISFWDPATGGFRGDASPIVADTPDEGEIALRVYGSIGSYEISAYGYHGFWKSPGGMDPATMTALFPALNVWGASARGPLGRGIGNVEIGLFDSRDDPDGTDPFINNGELRFLAGYERELGTDLTGGFQYYLEKLGDYDAYRASLPAGAPRDEFRHVVTTRITKLLRNQTLIPSLFAYYSPSDNDGYLRPGIVWKRSDRQILELGANLFFGRRDHTFFGQFANNSNVYVSLRLQP